MNEEIITFYGNDNVEVLLYGDTIFYGELYKVIFKFVLNYLCKTRMNGRNYSDIAREIGITPRQFRSWRNGKVMPHKYMITILCQVFDVPNDIFETAKLMAKIDIKNKVLVNEKEIKDNLSKVYPISETMKQSKYNNKKIYVDGIKFDSMKEAKRYRELKLLEKAGEIFDLSLQVPYVLQDPYILNGRAVRSIKYVADFVYYDKDGKNHVEDVKGIKTDVYKLKKKMLGYKYGIEIEEV